MDRETERLLTLPAILLTVLFGVAGLITLVTVLVDAFGH